MSSGDPITELPYAAKARIADNLYLQRQNADMSQDQLSELALITSGRIGAIESGEVGGMLDTWVRLAGALSVTLDDLLAGVTWIPGEINLEIEPGYEVTFEVEEPFADGEG